MGKLLRADARGLAAGQRAKDVPAWKKEAFNPATTFGKITSMRKRPRTHVRERLDELIPELVDGQTLALVGDTHRRKEAFNPATTFGKITSMSIADQRKSLPIYKFRDQSMS
jgi:hypothetical protein